MEKKTLFVIGVLAGIVVMILSALVMVNIFNLIPIVGPFFGGIVAGVIVGENFFTGAKAGLIAGLFGAIAVAIDFTSHTTYLLGATPGFAAGLGIFFLVLSLFYFTILGIHRWSNRGIPDEGTKRSIDLEYWTSTVPAVRCQKISIR